MRLPSTRLVSVAALAAVLICGSAISASATARHISSGHVSYPGTVNISFPVIAGNEFYPLDLGKDSGIFAKYGLNVNVEIVGSAALNAALESGALQFSVVASPAQELSYQEGVPIKLLATWGEHEAGYVFARPGFTKFSDLIGKPVGGSSQTAFGTIMVRYALQQAGVPWSSVTFVPISGGNPVPYIVSGEVDVAEGNLSSVLQAQAQLPGVSVLAKTIRLDWPCCNVWGYVPFITSHKAETVAMLRAINAAVVKWNADPTLAKQELAHYQALTNQGVINTAYSGTQQIFNKGSVPLHAPTTKDEAFVNKVLRLVGFPNAYNSYAKEGEEWTSTYWNAAFGKK